MIDAVVISLLACSLVCIGRFPCGRVDRLPVSLAVAIFFVLFGAFPAGPAMADTDMWAAPERITVTRGGPGTGSRTYCVALACDTGEKRTRGLQGFRRLRRDEAALFVFEKPEHATFWMGSVAYPIDIAFVDARGTVVRVFRNCPPGSRDLFPSGVPVKWVIETDGNSGIREGERVHINGPKRRRPGARQR